MIVLILEFFSSTEGEFFGYRKKFDFLMRMLKNLFKERTWP